MKLSRTLKLSLLLTFVLFGLIFFTTNSQMKLLDPPGRYVPGEVLVKFATGSKDEQRLAQLGAEKVTTFPDLGWQLFRLAPSMTVGEGMARFGSFPGVAVVQPNFIYTAQVSPNDPRYPELYALRNTGQIGGTPGADIRAEQAWAFTTGSQQVVVAVIDLGVDYNHEDLSANMWRNPGETGLDSSGANKATNHIDDDGNGYVDDVYGIDTINHDSDPMDDSGHGTHVAGTIGAVGNNAKGVVGVNWAVNIMAIKSHDSAGNGTSASVIEAFQYAAMMRRRGINVRVTNSSWGGAPEAPSYDQALKDAIDLAGNADILNVCAAGNSASNNDINPFYPASYDSPSIVAVAASDQNDNRATFSSFGRNAVDIAAPGVGILSTFPSNSYRALSGTSMATPQVSGAAALLCAYNRYLTNSQVKNLLMQSVDLLPQWSNLTVSGGRLNVFRALQNIPTTNQLDLPGFFVRQQYLDFLGRDGETDGLNYWTNEITRCGDPECVRRRRIGVSGAFFTEPEFQETGSFVYRIYKASLGRAPNFAEFNNDRSQVVFGPGLDQSKLAFANNWVTRDSFRAVYPLTMMPEEFVNRLFDTARLVPFVAERQMQIDAMRNGKTRAEVVRDVAEMQAFRSLEFNASFVLMQYFGYLRRDIDQTGYDFWLDILNNREPNNYTGMICAFITSAEYQLRFAPVVSHSNAECGP